MDEKLHKKLEQRKEKGTLRSLSSFEGMIDFASNDYLGLSKMNPISSIDHEVGATGSRLISGNSKIIESTEQDLANFFQAEAGLGFNSGYDANIGIFSSIPQRGDVVLYDEFIHASARDGMRLSLAKSYSFQHNNTNDLKRLLEANSGQTVYIAIESLYSMHGDVCPLREVVTLAKEYNAYIILDEAHSAGVYGIQGRGFGHAVDLHDECLIRLITFGKAYGMHGAIVLSSKPMRDYLINFSRSFIYTTALPTSTFELMKSRVKKDAQEDRLKLMGNIDYFRDKFSAFELISAPNSPIQFVRFGNVNKIVKIESQARENKFFVKAIAAPTVPEGSEGIRISLHSFNTKKEIDTLVQIMSA